MISKYRNKRTEYDGIKFDSIKEKNYYIKLKLLEKSGKIKDLKLQVKFELQPSFKFKGKTIRAINYVADFTYYEENRLVIVDTKGYRTKEYLLKKKMMNYRGYDIEEI